MNVRLVAQQQNVTSCLPSSRADQKTKVGDQGTHARAGAIRAIPYPRR